MTHLDVMEKVIYTFKKNAETDKLHCVWHLSAVPGCVYCKFRLPRNDV